MVILRALKNLIFFIIKEIFSFFIKLFLFIMLIVVLITGIVYKQNSNTEIKKNFFVKVNLNKNFLEQKMGIGLDFVNKNSMTFYDLINSLENTLEDTRVKGIILNLNNISLNTAQVEELGKILKKYRYKTKNPIYCYAENLGKKNFYLASFTDSLIMPSSNSTTVNIYPYFQENFYLKDFIDRFGVKFNIINIGDYKSYQENLSHKFMTKEAREDKTRVLENKYQEFLNTTSKNLKLNKEAFAKNIEDGDLVASNSVALFEKGLISSLNTLDEVENILGKDNIININTYFKDYVSSKLNSDNKIFVLSLEGEMGGVKEGIFDNISHISANKVVKILDRIEKDEDIKAVVLRVNSPGGSALVADKISKKIEALTKVKPVYTSMAGVAASGGYYVAALSNKIFLDKNTVTGSIGVISIVPEFTETLKKLGINNEKIMKGKYSDLYSASDFTQEKYEKIKLSNMRVYKDFLSVVSRGRKIEMKELEKIAGGRIWLGKEAIEIGLADEIGGLKDTIEAVARDNKLEDYSVVLSQEEFDLKDLYQGYSDFMKVKKLEILKTDLKENFLNNQLFNKPVMYYPYEI